MASIAKSILAGVFLIVFIFFTYQEWKLEHELKNFGVTTDAVALHVHNHHRRHSFTPECRVVYEFIVNEKKYTGSSSYSGYCKSKVNSIVKIVYSSRNYYINKLENHTFLGFLRPLIF